MIMCADARVIIALAHTLHTADQPLLMHDMHVAFLVLGLFSHHDMLLVYIVLRQKKSIYSPRFMCEM